MENSGRRMSLPKQIFVALVLFCGLFLIGFAVAVYSYVERSSIAHTEQQLIGLSEANKQQITLVLQQNIERVLLTGSRTQLRKMTRLEGIEPKAVQKDKMVKILLDAKNAIDDFIQIDIHDERGRILASTNSLAHDVGPFIDTFEKLEFCESLCWTQHYVADQQFIHIFTTIMMLEGENIGYISVHTPFEALSNVLNSPQLIGETGRLYLLEKKKRGDQVGYRALNQTEFAQNQNDNVPLQLTEAMFQRPAVLQTTQDDKFRDTYIVIQNLAGTPWSILISQSKDEALTDLNDIKQYFIWFLFIVLGIILLGAYWGAKKIASPIMKISQLTKQIANGDYELRLKQKGYIEIRELAKAINILSDKLITDNQNLEALVHDKTLHLEKLKDKAIVDNKKKSEFLANMSHEIRTPMNGVYGTLQLLKSEELSARGQDFLASAVYSTRALVTIINDILDFSKIEAGKLSLEMTTFRMSEIIDFLVSDLGVIAYQKKIRLKCDNKLQHDFFVGDPVRVRQILINLVSNAIKFTHRGGVTVSIEQVQESVRPDTIGNLKFTVADTGIGMDEAALERLFERFDQADQSTTRKYGGTGLGMSITRSLVTLMEGQVFVDSDPGLGSRFEVYLPLAEGEQFVKEATQVTKNIDLEGKTILVAEDNPINQVIVKSMLEPCRATIKMANNGLEAVSMAEELVPDLVLMDIQMPELDGVEACKQIKSLHPEIPIIALTANVMSEDIALYKLTGFNDHLPKPLEWQSLINILEKTLHSG